MASKVATDVIETAGRVIENGSQLSLCVIGNSQCN